MDHLEKAEHFGKQALALRKLAAIEDDPEVKPSLGSPADRYDRLSREAYARAGITPRK